MQIGNRPPHNIIFRIEMLITEVFLPIADNLSNSDFPPRHMLA